MRNELCLLLNLVILACCIAAPLSLQEQDPETIGGHFEGDIILDSSSRLVIKDPLKTWPNNTVYYRLDSKFDDGQKMNILNAMSIIASQTNVRFEKASVDRLDYVSYNWGVAGSGCNSQVGYLGRKQNINLANATAGTGCFTQGVLMHETLHTCGFWHQHSAPERDLYITIKWENMLPVNKQFFVKRTLDESTSFSIPYDCESIMHYGPKAFSSNGQVTIVPEANCTNVGQRRGLSEKDKLKLSIMYPSKIPLDERQIAANTF